MSVAGCPPRTDTPYTGPVPSPFYLVVTGPSGCGKSTLIRRLLGECPWLRKTVSATTRPPRPGETDGREYHFISPERFEERRREGQFLEHERYAGHLYGTLLPELDRGPAPGVVLDLDVRGARTLKRLHPDRTTVVFVKPPSLEVLEARLRGRSTESAERVAERLAIARSVMGDAERFDALVVNDVLDDAAAAIRSIAEGLRRRGCVP